MTQPLQGQQAVVTGGSRGIGRATAAALIGQGASVTIMGRSLDSLQTAADEIGARALLVDVAQPESVKRAFAEAGEVNILVNNAGIAESAPFQRTTLDLWERLISVNLTGTYLCTREVVPGMVERGYGRIVNIASVAALTGAAYIAAYCASKHGVLGLTRALAVEVAKKGITVNAVCPGYTNTDMTARTIANIVEKTGRTSDEAYAELVRGSPLGRLIQPEEVAHTVLWLCLPGSQAITGQAIAVAGGEVL